MVSEVENSHALAPELEFRIKVFRNLRYQEERIRFYEIIHVTCMLIIIGGSVTFTALPVDTTWHIVVPLVVSFAGVAEVVLRPSAKAAHHAHSREKMLDLYQQAQKGENLGYLREAYINALKGEDAKMFVINVLAQNSALSAFGLSGHMHVPILYRVAGRFFSLTSVKFRRARDVPQDSSFLLRLLHRWVLK